MLGMRRFLRAPIGSVAAALLVIATSFAPPVVQSCVLAAVHHHDAAAPAATRHAHQHAGHHTADPGSAPAPAQSPDHAPGCPLMNVCLGPAMAAPLLAIAAAPAARDEPASVTVRHRSIDLAPEPPPPRA